MATRRTSAPERIAGDILGFTTGGEVEESQSVLAKYFPELNIRIPAKGARGGRLGRAPQMAEQEIKYTPKEMVSERAGSAAGPLTVNVTAPAAQLPSTPDYSSQIEGLKQTLIAQSELLKNLGKKEEVTTQPTGSVKPQTAEEQAKEQITGLYKNVLGREPEEAGLNYWMGEGRAAGGLTPEEVGSMKRDFMSSPEYNIKKLYQEELGRTPDEAGLKYWTEQDPRSSDRLITPDELEQLRQSFRQSSEYKQKYGMA